MTQRLYYDDAYLTEFDATVLACRAKGDRFEVLLDRSAFYPTSGGQPYDTGTLGAASVTDVNVTGGDVWHTVDAALETGACVHGRIDWARRFDHMQQHAGDHMIAGALHRLMGGVTIGLHISEQVSSIDVAMPGGATRISPEDIRAIEADVNSRIQRDAVIRCWFPEADELASLPLRKEPTVSEHVRIVAIGDDEMVACGGTHPATAGQLGLVKIVSVAPARGKMRVSFVAGRRATEDYDRCSTAVHAAAEMLSTDAQGVPAAVEALMRRLHEAEYELGRVRREQLLAQIPDMLASSDVLKDGTRLIARTVEADTALLRDLASEMIRQPGVMALLGARNGDQFSYVFARSDDGKHDMGALLKASAKPYGGKGGGRPDFAQGGGCGEILEAARKAVLEA